MNFFKPIPDESTDAKSAGFTLRKIRKAGETDTLLRAEKLIATFVEDGEEMLVSEMNDLIDALHRAAMLVQKTKQVVLLRKLKKITQKKVE